MAGMRREGQRVRALSLGALDAVGPVLLLHVGQHRGKRPTDLTDIEKDL